MHFWCSSRVIRAALAATTLLLVGATPSAARNHGAEHRDAMLRAVESGEIQSLAEILNAVRGKLAGDITGIEIEREGDRWLYEFRVIDGRGRVFEVHIDARTGEIDRTKEK